MDPVTALGVAGNVITFVDLGTRIFSASRQVFRKGQVEEHIDFELVVEDLGKVSQDLEKSLRSPEDGRKTIQSEYDVLLRRLAKRSQEICHEISELLNKISLKDRQSRWSSLRAAVKTVWNEDRIDALQKRLDEIRQELIISVLMSFR